LRARHHEPAKERVRVRTAIRVEHFERCNHALERTGGRGGVGLARGGCGAAGGQGEGGPCEQGCREAAHWRGARVPMPLALLPTSITSITCCVRVSMTTTVPLPAAVAGIAWPACSDMSCAALRL